MSRAESAGEQPECSAEEATKLIREPFQAEDSDLFETFREASKNHRKNLPPTLRVASGGSF